MAHDRIYLDYASLTPIDPEVLKEMEIYSSIEFANPSSIYKEGIAAREALKKARTDVAGFLQAHVDEITFTSGGTEANNLAIIGSVEALHEQGVAYADMHVLTSSIEHSSVRECFNYLNGKDVKIDVVGVDEHGVVLLDELKKKIRPSTVIISVMMVNNEIGSIQPIREIAKIIRQARNAKTHASPFDFQSEVMYPLFHTDAAQAALYQGFRVEKLGVDLLTLDGSKMYGPRAVGVLYHKKNITLSPVLRGGGQERGLRSGTEPVAAIMGFAKAIHLIDHEKESLHILELRKMFIRGLQDLRKGILVNGSGTLESALKDPTQSPHIVNISIPRIDNEFFLLQLDAQGVACSTKSSCLRDEDESYVLKAIGVSSKTSLRFSFGRWTTTEEVTAATKQIGQLLAAQR